VTLIDPTIQTGHDQPFEVIIHTGASAVCAQAQELDALAASIPGTPVTARWPWTSVSVLDPAGLFTPWLVALMAGDELVAAALMLDDDSGSIRRTSLAGTEGGHRGTMLAASEPAAVRLGEALGEALMVQRCEFSVGPVRRTEAVEALIENLPVGLLIDDVAIPVVRSGEANGAAMSRGTTRTLRKAHNRMTADDVRSEIVVTDDRHVISGMLPLLESISRDRDYAGGRTSPLDDIGERRRWERRARVLAAEGTLRLATLLLDGELAAYLFGIVDGMTYRVLEGRYVSSWARYAPGRVLEAAVLTDVMSTPHFQTFDWMTAIAPESLLASNDIDPHIVIRGRS
jgi:hypothetical protein